MKPQPEKVRRGQIHSFSEGEIGQTPGRALAFHWTRGSGRSHLTLPRFSAEDGTPAILDYPKDESDVHERA
jgi:hypothetical protein